MQYDALYVPGGRAAIATLKASGAALLVRRGQDETLQAGLAVMTAIHEPDLPVHPDNRAIAGCHHV